MALGLLLWISLLLNFSAGFSAPTGGQYQSLPDTPNQLDEEFFNALANEGVGDVLDNKPSGPPIIRYNWPLVPANQNPPNTVDQPEPQTRPMRAELFQSVSSPNAAEWSGQRNEVDSLTVQVSPPWKPSSPTKVGKAPSRDWMSMPFSDIFDDNLFFGQLSFQPENSVSFEKYWVPMPFPQVTYQPDPPRPSRKSLIMKSKNGYRRERLLQSKNAYWSPAEPQQMKAAKNLDPIPKRVPNRKI